MIIDSYLMQLISNTSYGEISTLKLKKKKQLSTMRFNAHIQWWERCKTLTGVNYRK